MANTLSPEEAAKVRELESQLDFLKVQKAPEAPAKITAPDKQPETAAQDAPKENQNTSAPAEQPGGMSALDRARASRFAPPKHILQQMSGDDHPPVKKEDNNQAPKADDEKKSTTESPAVEVPKPEAPKPVGPKPVGPKPAGPQSADPQPVLKPAITVEEAKKQGLIAPGTYGKPAENDNLLKGDTKEIPTISEPVEIKGITANESEKAKAHPAVPIKNPLPVPRKHVAKDMDFDIEVPLADMHFDIVDMSGKDFFDID